MSPANRALLGSDEGTEHPRVDLNERGRRVDGEIDVRGREHAGARHARGGGGVDLADPRVGPGRADEGRVQGTLDRHVVDVLSAPHEEPRVLLATHSLADHARHLCGH